MASQNEVVVAAVSKVFANELSESGRVPETGKWSDTQKNEVVALVFTSFKNGECAKTSGGTDDASLMKYIPGLINNHVRKDTRLNGGVKYTAKNPGSRSGSGDESVKAMRALLSVTTDEAARATIQAEIDKRLSELKPKPVIKADDLPESLRHLLNS